jgi:hypothetical protein
METVGAKELNFSGVKKNPASGDGLTVIKLFQKAEELHPRGDTTVTETS